MNLTYACLPGRPLRPLVLAAFGVAWVAGGCSSESQSNPSSVQTGAVAPTVAPETSAKPPAPTEPATPETETLTEASPVRVGGPWVRCYGNFHPGGEPIKDVTRLSLLCGPENGMRRLSHETVTGRVSLQAPHRSTLEAHAGDCYRVFAVGDADIANLDIRVLDASGHVLAHDHGSDRWPIAPADRPFCALSDGPLVVETAVTAGGGTFALETWVLRREKRAH